MVDSSRLTVISSGRSELGGGGGGGGGVRSFWGRRGKKEALHIIEPGDSLQFFPLL